MWMSPLYLIKPSFLNLFINKLTRPRVVPIRATYSLFQQLKFPVNLSTFRPLWGQREAVARFTADLPWRNKRQKRQIPCIFPCYQGIWVGE